MHVFSVPHAVTAAALEHMGSALHLRYAQTACWGSALQMHVLSVPHAVTAAYAHMDCLGS